WEQCTIGVGDVRAINQPLHYGMGVGTGKFIVDGDSPPRIESLINEHYQLWMYRVWSEFMSVSSWKQLKESHSKPQGVV
ncbi:MAG: aromatic ring-hydroxylating dioxygenase subunit alpha, partial [Gammaproteobacteria bacterium]|nr:aromatic ring-hydroxylating dioxygenase subunit alpha [Gammaproteobacteria bacterium]